MIKTCIVCGTAFDALRSAVCCSVECSKQRKEETIGLWHAAHPEEGLEKSRRYESAHHKERLETHNQWRKDNPEKARRAVNKWARLHPDAVRESNRKTKNTDKYRVADMVRQHNRRSRLSVISMTTDMVVDLKSEYGGICPYCNTTIVKGHVDHIVPVSKGGTNERNNLAWVCQTCNVQKHNRTLLEFMLYRMNTIAA